MTRAHKELRPPPSGSTNCGAPGSSARPRRHRPRDGADSRPARPRRYPDRIVPKNVEAAVKLKERTLTNLYNLRPRWLSDAHDALDRAVANAYGWPEDISTEDALQRLLASNLERVAGQAGS